MAPALSKQANPINASKTKNTDLVKPLQMNSPATRMA